MPRVVALRSTDRSKSDVVSLVLSQDAVVLGPNGDPWCGVSLSAEQARSLANRLSNIAAEIENQEEPGYRVSEQSLLHVSSVVVVHDGSQLGHRAFEAAMEFARRCLGTLDLIGIFGIDH